MLLSAESFAQSSRSPGGSSTRAASVQARGTVSYAIPPQSLASALAVFGETSGLQVIYSANLARGIRTAGLSGQYTREEALLRLLAGSKLTYRFTGANTVTLASTESAGTVPESSYAQSSPNSMELPTITVEARKRGAESVQKLPDSVFVYGAEELDRTLTRGIEGVLRQTPNANFEDRPSGDVVINLRGNGTGGANTDSGIGLYVDGAYNYIQGNNNNIPFFDIEQVNVLLGPQGALYGRNAVGGAINVQTANPTNRNEGRVTGEIGNYNSKRLEAVVNAASPDGVARVRVAGVHNERDSFYFNQTLGRPENGVLQNGGRIKFGFTPNERLDVVVGAEHIEQNLPGNALTRGPDARSLLTFTNIIGDVERRSSRFMSDIKFAATDWLAFRSITGYHLPDGRSFGDADTGPSRNAAQTNRSAEIVYDAKQLSQEFRFSSPESFGGPFSWLAGVNYFNDQVNFRQDNRIVSFANAGRLDRSAIAGTIDQYALFAEGTYEILQGLKLTGSVRYSNEEKHIIVNTQRFNPNGALAPGVGGLIDATDVYERINPAANLTYDWTSNIMTYVKVATAYKSGGVNFGAVPPGVDQRFAPEDVISYEAGIRTSWFDERLILNATAFHQNQKDLQLRIIDLPTGLSFFQNVGTGVTDGVELTLRARPVTGLDLSATYGYLSPKFDEAPRVGVTFANGMAGNANVSGNRVPFISEHTWNFAASYRTPLFATSIVGFVTAEYYVATGGFHDALNIFPLNRKQNANFSVGIEDENWRVKAFVKNAFDDAYFEVMPTFGSVASLGFPLGMRNAPRTFGASATLRW